MVKNKKQNGFTLVELMVVLVIIGILSSMAIPKFMGLANKTKATECKVVLTQIHTLQSIYHMENTSYAKSNTTVGFKPPVGKSNYEYTVQSGAKGDIVGSAKLIIDLGKNTKNKSVCINSLKVITAETSELASLLNSEQNPDCSF